MNEIDKEAQLKNEQKTVTKPAGRQLPTWFPWAAAAVAALLVAMISYGAGYQMSRRYSPVGFGADSGMMRGGNNFNRRDGGGADFRGRGGMMGSSVGEVSAVSADSITIKDTMRGGSVTYKIDNSTKVVENGNAKSVSDIKTGNTVRITATGTDTAIATEIVLGTN